MASYFFAFTILVVVSVAYSHEGSEGRGGSERNRGESERNRDGSEHNAFSNVFEAFIQSLNATQRDAYFSIFRDWNLTKAERQEQLDTFSTGLAGEAKALINNQSISDVATFKAIGELVKNQTSEVQKELESLWPHFYANQNLFHQGGSENYAFLYVFGKFIQSLNATQREAYFNITRNWNLTKAECQAQVDSWSASLGGEAKILYQNLSATFQECTANFTQKLQTAVDNLNATAKPVGEEILALIKNQSISYAATFKAIDELTKTQSPEVQKELESLWPHVDAHRKNSFHGEHGNDNRNSNYRSENGNSARGSENGNSARGGENGNSEHGRQQHEIRAKRLI
uniref:SXP/RAL-2 family protein Ani s 5-like cation-binding domain-containing protein n=1 Tax=Acrobeloides nanus TaxID=290746 RepID=A0A914E496_9BILA